MKPGTNAQKIHTTNERTNDGRNNINNDNHNSNNNGRRREEKNERKKKRPVFLVVDMARYGSAVGCFDDYKSDVLETSRYH